MASTMSRWHSTAELYPSTKKKEELHFLFIHDCFLLGKHIESKNKNEYWIFKFFLRIYKENTKMQLFSILTLLTYVISSWIPILYTLFPRLFRLFKTSLFHQFQFYNVISHIIPIIKTRINWILWIGKSTSI